jgi:hypothetical protein
VSLTIHRELDSHREALQESRIRLSEKSIRIELPADVIARCRYRGFDDDDHQQTVRRVVHYVELSDRQAYKLQHLTDSVKVAVAARRLEVWCSAEQLRVNPLCTREV